ncbi:glycosyltransferase [Laspinema sp. D1]|uniref:Glycosyltransferase n=1 Tax=Laspinema palackyanum D2a TaxID=2953684 RepID=A0ABT2MUV3_9CYAN|nr:glycosyltransferase [Laspinema sp. D2a]
MSKILYYTDCPFFGGCENMLPLFLNSERIKNKYEIVFCYRYSVEYKNDLEKRIVSDIPVIPLTFISGTWPKKNFIPPFNHISKPLQYLSTGITRLPLTFYEIFWFIRFFKKLSPDIVHLNNGGYPAARTVRSAAIAARLAGVKSVIMVVNNMAAGYTSLGRVIDAIFDRWVVHSVTIFITASKSAATRLQSVLRLPNKKIKFIPNGIEPIEIYDNRNKNIRIKQNPCRSCEIIISVVGLLVERKGHRFLLDAIKIIKDNNPHLWNHLKLWVIGDGELRQSLECYAKSLEISENIVFWGHRPDVLEKLFASDFLVLPSIKDEDFPFVILEAMLLGKPVISTYVAGIPEQVEDGKTGLLVQPGDALSLSKAISELCRDPKLIKKMGEAGKQRFESNFTSDISLKSYLDLYDLLLCSLK